MTMELQAAEAQHIPSEHEAGIVPRKRPKPGSANGRAPGHSAAFAGSPLPRTGLPLELWTNAAAAERSNGGDGGCNGDAVLLEDEGAGDAHYPVASTSGDNRGSSTRARRTTPLDLTNPVLLTCVLSRLDAESLCRVGATSKAFSQLTEPSAKAAMELRPKTKFLSDIWRGESWKKLLHLSESFCGFDTAVCQPEGFSFARDKNHPDFVHTVTLNGMGPKLLLSDKSTMDQPILYWRVSVEGNTAIEFGVVAEDSLLQGEAFSVQLHKAKRVGQPGKQADGFASKHTHGSELSMRVPVFRGSVVDILASRGAVSYRVSHPDHAKEIVQRGHGQTMQGYSGPKEFRFSHSLSVDSHLKLACTLWSRGKLINLHPY